MQLAEKCIFSIMNRNTIAGVLLFLVISLPALVKAQSQGEIPAKTEKKAAWKQYLYVATPGIRDYLGYGGHGILVFDIQDNHRFVKRIRTQGLHPDGKPSNVKGIAV